MRLFGVLAALLLLSGTGLFSAFSIVQPVAAQYDGGPSIPPNSGFGSGESIFLSFDLAGYKPEGDEEQKTKLSWQCQAFDADGVALTPIQKGEVKVGLAPEDKKWRPRVRVELPMPQGLVSAPAEIRLSAVDHVASANASLVVPFRTRGIDVSGVTALQPRRFRFLRTEESNEPLAMPAYRQGDTLWARFEIAGYKLGEKNSFKVSYGLEVFRANGESLFQQEEAANEAGNSFYPRRYLLGALSLQLTKDLAPGEYTIALRLRDGNSEQRSETRYTFRVE